jgi:UDP:flavonoid glycosyltransferase YjiC (YdhE family)
MEFELPYRDIELPSGAEPLVLVAPSTSQDPKNRLIRIAFEALAEEPVRVVATFNRVYPTEPIEVPDNAMLVEWLSYSQVIPRSSLVICHGGHGTVARALGAGVPVLACPIVGDMSENAARVAWAKVGLALPWRLCRPGSVRWAVRRVLGDPGFRVCAEEVAAWGRANDGAQRGAEAVEGVTVARD